MKRVFSFLIAMVLVLSAFCGVSVNAETMEEYYMVVSEIETYSDGSRFFETEHMEIEDWLFGFSYDPDDEDTEVTFLKDGEEISAADIVVGDVLALTEYEDEERIFHQTVNVSSNNFVKAVQSVDLENMIITTTDGEEYPCLFYEIPASENYRFYLNHHGDVVHMVPLDETKEYSYGVATFLTLWGESENISRGELRILTTEGVWETLPLADIISIDNYDTFLNYMDPEWVFDSYDCTEGDGYYKVKFYDLIAYKTNSSGEVFDLIGSSSGIEDSETDYWDDFSISEYEAYYGSLEIDINAKVFNIGLVRGNKILYNEQTIFLTDMSYFDDGDYYEAVYVCNYGENGYGIVAGVFDLGMDFSQPLFTVVDIHENAILNGKEGTVIEGIENGVTRAYLYDEGYSCVYGVTVDGYELSVTNEEVQVNPGDVLTVYAKDGVIIDAAKVFDVDDYATANAFTSLEKNHIAYLNEEWDGYLVSGYVAAVNGNRAFLSTDESLLGTDKVDDLYEVLLSNGAATYYDFTKEEPVLTGSISDIKPGTMVLAKCESDEFGRWVEEAVVILNESSYDYEIPAVKENNYNYGFVTKLSLTGTQGNYESAKIRMLLPSNEWETFDIAEEVTINGEIYSLCTMTGRAISEALNLNAYGSDVEGYCDIIFNQMVCYDVNENGEIDEIIFGMENINEVETAKIYSGKYTDNMYLGFYNLTDSTKIYNYTSIPVNEALDESNITVTDISVLNKNEEYNDVAIYGITDENPTIGIMLGSFEAEVDFESPFFVVSKVLTVNVVDMACLEISGSYDGEEVTLFYNPETANIVGITEVDGYAASSFEKVTPVHGDVLSVKVDSNGFILRGVKIWNVNDFADEDYFIMPEEINGYNIKGEDESRFVTGFVCERNSTRTNIGISLNPEHYQEDIADDWLYIKGANVTGYDFTVRTKDRIYPSGVNAIEPGTMLLARVDDMDKVIDAVVIINDATDREEDFVRVPVTGVTLAKQEMTLAKGGSSSIKATVSPENASNNQVVWSSSDTSVATVLNGTINAVAEGTAIITATTADGGFTASCTVNVTGAKLEISDIATLRCSSVKLAEASKKITVTVDRFDVLTSSGSVGVAAVVPEGITVTYNYTGDNGGEGSTTGYTTTKTDKYTLASTGANTELGGGGALGRIPVCIFKKTNGTRMYVDVILSNGTESVTYKMTIALSDIAVQGNVNIQDIKPLRADPDSFVVDNEAKTIYYETLAGVSSAGFAVSVDNGLDKSTRPRRLLTAKSGMSLAHGDIKTAEKDTFDRYVVARRSKGSTQTYQVKVHGGENGLTYTWYTVTVVFK